MDYNLNELTLKVKNAKIFFLKIITANDVGATGAHQAGFHLPKNSWPLFFDSPGQKGQNKDKYVTIRWNKNIETESRAIYYGKRTRNEYRLTRFGLNFPYLKNQNIDDLLLIIRNFDNSYEGFVINKSDIKNFFENAGLNDNCLNSIHVNDPDLEIVDDLEDENLFSEAKQSSFEIFNESDAEDEKRQKVFNPKAHILSLLGDELIKSPVMAIYELVKNSYDADALKADVYFNDIEDKEGASIIVEDNGSGMTDTVIENVWLEPGSDYRKPIDPVTGQRIIVKSPIYKRVPMGEKGIGRFAVHKLGTKILLITRPRLIKYNPDKSIDHITLADYEVQLYINWDDFNQKKHLSDIPISWKLKKDPAKFRFKEGSGTYIKISGLKENWTRGMARELKNHTLSMLSPKLEKNSFKINLNFNNEWLKDSPSIDDFLDEAPYKIRAFIDKQFNLYFDYEFSLKNNSEIGSRTIKDDDKYNRNIKGYLRPFIRTLYERQGFDDIEIEELLKDFDEKVESSPFGDLLFEFYSYDLDAASLRDYSSDNRATRTILKEHAGIKVFKGALRVFDYGEKGNDWMGIDLERIQNKEWFSNNQNIGYIYLDPEQSTSLVEKTNREGFVHNKSYELFQIIIKYLLTEFKNTRLTDRNRWLNYNRKASEKTFDARLQTFKYLVEKSDIDNDEKKQRLIDEAGKLEEKYEEDTKVLLIPAGVGMTASVALHEIEKLIPRMEETVSVGDKDHIDKDIAKEQVAELRLYTEGIISVLRKGGKEYTDINKAIIRASSNYNYKLQDRGIQVKHDLDEEIGSIKVEKRFLITILMNLLDNSIYWLDTVYRDERSVLIKSIRINGVATIIIADNGPGFKDDISQITSPFFSRKSDGIGIGLYLVDTIMMKYGKFDIVNKAEATDIGIPSNYDGAIVKLVFNKI